MKHNLYHHILSYKSAGKKMLALLLDPDKMASEEVSAWATELHNTPVTHILVGGSQADTRHPEELVVALKKLTDVPILLFPGHPQQITSKADGLLFLSLLNSQNADYLIGLQTQAAPLVKASGIEVLSTAYILVDGKSETTVQQVTQTKPVLQHQIEKAAHLALAAEFLGMQLIYLEAGSGACEPVPVKMIEKVRKEISIPLIVGGGMRSTEQIIEAYKAGADLVVIGTIFEKKPDFLKTLNQVLHE
jgi:phosphoglycerol geranylgeranyltransferase